MAMEYCVVAFIDVLGFSEMVKADAPVNGSRYLQVFRDTLEAVRTSFSEANNALDVKMFSDSIVLAAPLSPAAVVEILRASADLQRRFLAQGILLRGGVSYGKHFADNTVMFSEGLISAYRLESTLAKYPRIVVDKNVIDYFVNHTDAGDDAKTKASSLMVQDRDRHSFVHYLHADDFAVHSEHVSRLIQRQLKAPESVLEKLRWLNDYHGFCAQNFGQAEIEVPNWFKRMQPH